MNYRANGHIHRLQIISPPVGANRPPTGLIDFHCHACGTTIQVIKVTRLGRPPQYHIFNTF